MTTLATLAGWFLEIPRLTDWFGVGIAMKANAAIAGAVAGAGLILLSLRSPPWAVRCAGAFVAALGGLRIARQSGFDGVEQE